jgi:hypothetical protein
MQFVDAAARKHGRNNVSVSWMLDAVEHWLVSGKTDQRTGYADDAVLPRCGKRFGV